MKSLMRRCGACSRYSLVEKCPKCGAATVIPIPPRYSPEDRYSSYRKRMREIWEAEQHG
jgi:H/ACA ribonucleoprotein complex subunit 3